MNEHCRDMEERIQRWLDRELGPAEEAAAQEHLARCNPCRSMYGPLLETIRAVEQAPTPEAPAGLYERVLSHMPTVEVARPVERILPGRFLSRLGWVSAAAAAVMLAVLWPGTHPIPGDGGRPGGGMVVAATGPVDPIAMACLAAMPYAGSSGAGGAVMALVGTRLAQEQSGRMAAEPVRIALCMATPAETDERPAPPISDVIQMISNRAAMHGGL